MRRQMEETDDYCGFVIAKHEVPSLRVAWHGSYQGNRVQMQIKSKDQSTHWPVFFHLCAIKAAEKGSRSVAARQYRKQRRREKRH